MDRVNVLVLAQNVRDSDLAVIAAIDPRVNLLDGRSIFDAEYARTWPPETIRRLLGAFSAGEGDEGQPRALQAERDDLLGQTDVIIMSIPYPTTLVSRAPRLKWVHQTPAGASNLRFGDIWGSPVPVTTSRGWTNSTAHAEWVIGAMLIFAKDFPQSFKDRQGGVPERRHYRPRLLVGKTVGIVGLGGIGKEVARLARALGLRAIATKRSVSGRILDAEGVDELFPPAELHQLLAQSDFVVISTQWTPETEKLIGREELKAMKRTGYLINVARGEIVDEAALCEALREGTIAGAALDVREGENLRPPSETLLTSPNLIYTPHISGGTDVRTHRGIELFCQNLARFLARQELVNLVDWERGY
ncbi:MAG: NAD(P)-dependent oxidoreductase [Dehalococcoidia bacterium]|nr:NAD(P)-dependent oxidoreductase [Dehalococcoidia bacterium]